MKIFNFTADIEFEAEDIYSAFSLLKEHFCRLRAEEEPEVWFIGKMDLQPKIKQNDILDIDEFAKWPEHDFMTPEERREYYRSD